MSDPFDNVNLLRIIQESETLFDKPGSEEFLSQLRENWEVLTMLMLYTGDSGTATENPSETVLTDGNATYDADEHDGRSLVIIDGLAAGNIYEIDATAATTLTCTGDTLLADGVKSGDAYKIFYNLKHATAHTHDDVDSPFVVLADNQVTQAKMADSAIGQAELKKTIAESSQDVFQEEFGRITLPGGFHGLVGIKVKGETTDIEFQNFEQISITTSYQNIKALFYNNHASAARFAYIQQQYIQASGEVFWYMVMRDKATKEIIAQFSAPDHPCMMQNISPEDYPHPWVDEFDPNLHEIIVINPDVAGLEDIRKFRSIGNRTILEVIETNQVGALLIGLPLNMDGSEGPRAQSTRAFARNLARLVDVPMVFWDERLSTAAVERHLIEADASRKRRAQVIDRMAAAYILQGALDRLRGLAQQS